MNDLDLTERLDRPRERLRDEHQTVTDPLLDAKDAAAVLKISAYTVRQRARRREIPTIRLGKFWRFRRSSRGCPAGCGTFVSAVPVLMVTDGGWWWARWRTRHGRRPHRKLGPARTSGRREGLTKREAEATLRELVLADNGGERSRNRAAPTVKEMGEALIARMRRDDLKRSHIERPLGISASTSTPCSATCSSPWSSRATPIGWSRG